MPLIALLMSGILGKVWAFLRHASFWQLAFLAVSAFALVQHLQLRSEQRHTHKVEEQLHSALAELKRISTAKNEQKQTTVRNIDRVKVITRDAEKRAEKVEQAPLPGQCRTPAEIMGADL